MLPLTTGFLLSGGLSDRDGSCAFATTGEVLSGLAFVGLMLLPVDFYYPYFALIHCRRDHVGCGRGRVAVAWPATGHVCLGGNGSQRRGRRPYREVTPRGRAVFTRSARAAVARSRRFRTPVRRSWC